jgi:hypothetical protein
MTGTNFVLPHDGMMGIIIKGRILEIVIFLAKRLLIF